jgi:hypothetical protein
MSIRNSGLGTTNISADLDWLGLETSGGMRPQGATGPPSSPGTDVTLELEAVTAPSVADLEVSGVEVAAENLHRPILVRLTVSSAELGKAYSLGVGLARTDFRAEPGSTSNTSTHERRR